MPSGVIFVIYIPSYNLEHTLRYGKQKELISIDDQRTNHNLIRVNLRDKKSKSIPVHLTSQYYNEAFNPLESINEVEEFFAMESVSTNIVFFIV